MQGRWYTSSRDFHDWSAKSPADKAAERRVSSTPLDNILAHGLLRLFTVTDPSVVVGVNRAIQGVYVESTKSEYIIRALLRSIQNQERKALVPLQFYV